MCIWDKNKSSLQACRSKTWDFCPKKRYTPPTWESLQARNVHNIARLEESHKESQVLPASIIVQEASFPQNTVQVQKWKVQIFKSHKSLQSNRLGSWGKPEDLRWSPWKGKLAKVFLGEISVRVVMSLKSCLWRTSHDWNSSITMTSTPMFHRSLPPLVVRTEDVAPDRPSIKAKPPGAQIRRMWSTHIYIKIISRSH